MQKHRDRYGQTIAYAEVEGSAGNRSAPASITICMAAIC
jgi:hypothetical protein